MKILHRSMFEYLLLYGTPIGTKGHPGREWIELWDFVFDGELWCCGRAMGWAVRTHAGPSRPCRHLA